MLTTYIALGAGAVLLFGVWLAFRQARKRGEAEAEGRANKRSAEHAREANETREDVARLRDADLDRELRRTRPK